MTAKEKLLADIQAVVKPIEEGNIFDAKYLRDKIEDLLLDYIGDDDISQAFMYAIQYEI